MPVHTYTNWSEKLYKTKYVWLRCLFCAEITFGKKKRGYDDKKYYF